MTISDEVPADEFPAKDGLVTLAAAAEQLGVHYMTAYRYVRTGRMIAEKRSGKWWIESADLAAVIEEGTGARRRPESSSGQREFPVNAFTARLIAGDTAGCWDLISASLSSGARPADIHESLITPSLAEIGNQWREGTLSIAAEHRATASAYRLVGQLGPQFRHRGRRRGTIVLGSVTQDMHALPVAIMADLLSDRRFEVIDLGANTPTDSFVEAANSVEDLIGVGIGVALSTRVEAARLQLRDLRQALGDTVIVVGGSAIASSSRRCDFEAEATVVSRSQAETIAAFEEAAEVRGLG